MNHSQFESNSIGVAASSVMSPDFIIAGAQKCGTSSLYFYLRQHPHILPAPGKELHFFSGGLDSEIDDFVRGVEWYQAKFPKKTEPGIEKTFEATPLYLFHPQAASRIASVLPNVKLIFLLRNPTERAISHYFHVQKSESHRYSLEEALQKEEDSLHQIILDQDYKNPIFRHHSYKARGLYKDQLQRYFDHFPQEQILILSTEELISQTDSSLKRIFEFVGVDPEFRVENKTAKNVSANRTIVPQEEYDSLNSFFKRPNAELFQFLGKRFDW